MSKRYSKYILDSIKNNFGVEEKYETEGFPDLNYEVGNTSGLDVAPGVPSAMDERIGSLSQRGGSVMEVIINNPATFQLDKDKMFNVINQLGINISLHSDPSIGFASAYKTQSQGGAGYDPAHQYFTNYLEQFAIFKTELEKRDDIDFEISRINPHISTSPLPSLTERMAADVGQDPFGFPVNEITEESFDERNSKGRNIFKNQEFLKKLYRIFIVEETGYEYQYYGFLADFSDEFEDEWREAQKKALNEYWDDETGGTNNGRLEDKVAIIRTASSQDPGSETRWLRVIEDIEFDKVDDAPLDSIQVPELDDDGNPTGELVEITNLKDAERIISSFASETSPARLSQLRQLPEIYHYLHQASADQSLFPFPEQDFEEVKQTLEAGLEKAVDYLWEREEDDTERTQYYISIEAQTAGINNRLEIPQRRIQKRAFQLGDGLEESAAEVFAGSPGYFDDEDEEGRGDYFRFFRNLMRNFEQQLWMESNLFYKIIPAWMSTASEHVEEDGNVVHEGWKSPEFVWKNLVVNKWEDREKDNGENFEINLNKPQESDYFRLLENNREFQLDVAAASGIAYVWGHFTQRKGHFQISREQYVDDLDERRTWIDWMNEYGIGVNLEAMPGGPQQLLKIWRPKDIVTAARAINMTASNVLEEDGELGGREEFHPDLDERPAKFTIDLEHTATFGVNPWHEMEELIDQEKNLADSKIAEEYGIEIDKEKPLAKILRMWHLMRAGLETSQSETLHGPWDRGNTQLYKWLYKMVEAGFCRNPDEEGWIMYEVGGDDRGTVYTARIAMNLIELGVKPEDLDPTAVDPSKKEYGDEKEALMARFFGMDKSTYDREWAKIEEHAFDPLEGLLEAEQFDYTWSSQAAIENDNRPQDWMEEEYK